jgi:hypothetical protein
LPSPESVSATTCGCYAYRGSISGLPGGYGACAEPGISINQTTIAAGPPAGSGWFYLVTGVNVVGEGPMGIRSDGQPRESGQPCRLP